MPKLFYALALLEDTKRPHSLCKVAKFFSLQQGSFYVQIKCKYAAVSIENFFYSSCRIPKDTLRVNAVNRVTFKSARDSST